MLRVVEYCDSTGRRPFKKWFDRLDAVAAAKVTTALLRLAQSNTSNTKSVHEGVLEYRIEFGPGLRIYFARDGDALVILLGGGTKRRQQTDIVAARLRWADYKVRKKMARN
jgi:putative addiction module killer protein